ncbi:F510_1955 family glycosylhydrolase [Litchfieldia salsa]|uniref:Glycosyl hydrolase n=1 Tax=Litchfieldia salsa TaxID=930152 RepID=A0A1H0WAR1_9BACI|nr:hypothetical protein [Litchfieldia salsa]SDP87830.1 hypothetical protein SAMN05216565_11045 [Litchfieldia salsa]
MKKLKTIPLLATILYGLQINVLAHGTAEEHQQEALVFDKFIQWGLIASSLVFLMSVIYLIYTTKRLKIVKGKAKFQLQKTSTIFKWLSTITLVSTIILGFISLNKEDSKIASGMELMHIHGIGHTNDGMSFFVPAHDGLREFSDGVWRKPEGEQHDYMGFSMVDEGFYSSGHPAVGSKLGNPFGIVKSNDLGKNLDILDLYKEVDFHGMAVGYYSHAIYVLNQQPNSRMEDTGLYFTVDDTKTWTKSEMKGLEGQAASIAVHQENEKIVAVGTEQGAYISNNYGNTFESIVPNVPTSAIHFTKDNTLFVGGFDNGSILTKIDLDSKDKTMISLPDISNEDAISYISVNPQNSSEIVITTFERFIYLSQDGGKSWSQIAKEGNTININKEN